MEEMVSHADTMLYIMFYGRAIKCGGRDDGKGKTQSYRYSAEFYSSLHEELEQGNDRMIYQTESYAVNQLILLP